MQVRHTDIEVNAFGAPTGANRSQGPSLVIPFSLLRTSAGIFMNLQFGSLLQEDVPSNAADYCKCQLRKVSWRDTFSGTSRSARHLSDIHYLQLLPLKDKAAKESVTDCASSDPIDNRGSPYLSKATSDPKTTPDCLLELFSIASKKHLHFPLRRSTQLDPALVISIFAELI